MGATATDDDWRLEAKLHTSHARSLLDRLVGRGGSADAAHALAKQVSADVVVTHDGDRLFAYAASRDAVHAAKRVLEHTLRSEGVAAEVVLASWDDAVDEWRQVDPPPATRRTEQAIERSQAAPDSRTLVVNVGKLIRGEVEQTMRDWAERLGLKCELVEHPHLLDTQVAFTVSGPRRKLDEFAAGLRAEELATIRTELTLQMSAL